MGYLHDGHLSLVRRARSENDRVGVSIYVNPRQFAPHEDLNSYPRDLDKDLSLLEDAGVDCVFAPDDATMYPPEFQSKVLVMQVTKVLEGATRPTHFEGVTTVVSKLFNMFQPHRAYFGQKDAQQALVIRRMVADLNFNLEVVVCPIVREPDGLAKSSRNRYLQGAGREAAAVLSRALRSAANLYDEGERSAALLKEHVRQVVAGEPLVQLDYVSVADPANLQEQDTVSGSALISLAAYIGSTRLIDNVLVGDGQLGA
jgi:pantoate--beta-alanine ligase